MKNYSLRTKTVQK